MKKNWKKPNLTMFLVITGMILIITGTSFALFSESFQSTKTHIIQAGKVKLEVTEPVSGIDLGLIQPMSDVDGLLQGTYYEFSIENIGDTVTKYKVLLVDDEQAMQSFQGDILSDEYVNVGLEVNGNETGPMNLDEVERIINENVLEVGQIANYQLRLWIDELTDVGNEGGKAIFLKIKVEAEQCLEDCYVPATQSSCFTWTETSTTATITDYKCYAGNSYSLPTITDVVIPKKLNGKEVTIIGEAASNCRTTVDISFCNKGITSVILPSTLVTIGNYAFYYNQLTGHLTIPNSVTSIGDTAFRQNQINSLTLGNSVYSIGIYAFAFNELSGHLAIPDSVTTIKHNAFQGNTTTNKISSLTIGNNVQTIGDYAFAINQLSGHLAIPDSVTTIGNYTFMSNQISSLTIPSSVTSIGNGAFNSNLLPSDSEFIYKRNSNGTIDSTTIVSYGGANQINIVIPSGVTTIGQNTFYYNQINKITLATSVTTIGNDALNKSPTSNTGLLSIVNPTGRSFDWGLITINATGSIFITGTITHPQGNITVSAS